MTEPFWMIHASGGGPTGFRHSSRGDAEREAEKLARANPGTEFVLLEAREAFLVPLPPIQRRFLGKPVDRARLPDNLGAVFGTAPRPALATAGPADTDDEIPF